jgi:hypothetical protein
MLRALFRRDQLQHFLPKTLAPQHQQPRLNFFQFETLRVMTFAGLALCSRIEP